MSWLEKKIRAEALEAVKELPQFGEWQLCPKCYGTGLLQPPYEIQGTSIVAGTCNLCKGAMVILKPIINKEVNT